MTLPVMPSKPSHREALRIGGGYGASAEGQSPAGGLDIDNAGRLATDGDITCSGGLLAAGDFAVTGRDLEWVRFLGAEEMRSGLSATMKTFFAARVYLPCLPCPATVDTSFGAAVAPPPSYAGGALQFTVYWTSDVAPGAGNNDVQWVVTAAVIGDGDTLAVNAASGSFLSVLVRRLGTLPADTFDQPALLLGMRIEMA